MFILRDLLDESGQSKREVAVLPPRGLLSFKDEFTQADLAAFQRGYNLLVDKADPHKAGRLLWPLAARIPRMRPSISWMYTNQAIEEFGAGRFERSLLLAQMALAFNQSDYRASQTAWGASERLGRTEEASGYYQGFLQNRPAAPDSNLGNAKGFLGLMLVLLLVTGLVMHQYWDRMQLKERFEGYLISDLEPAPASPGPESFAGEAQGAQMEHLRQVAAEKKKSITAILSADAFLRDVQQAFDNKDYEKGVDYCAKAVEINPTNSGKAAAICLAEGIRLYEIGDHDNARELLEVSLHFEPHVLEAHTCLGNTYIKLGDFERARSQYEKVIEVDPRNGEAYYTLGVCYQKVNDIPRAKRSFQVAVQLKDHPNSHFYLAKLLEGEKDYATAVVHWTRFVELAPGSPQAEAARQRIQKLVQLAGAQASGGAPPAS